MTENYHKVESVMIPIGMVVTAGLFINVGNILVILLGIDNQVMMNIVLAISSSIGFIAIPLLFLHYLGFKLIKLKFNVGSAIILTTIVLFISIFIFKSEEVAHAFIIATCEEILFRLIILSVLLSSFKKRDAIILGSLMFGILLHLNGDFLINFMTKFPASIILYILADRFGLQSAIAFHWFYNICIGSLLG
ncbi:CPBP family intramembrane glutamic endopeptidase [Streptococcus sp. sy010]|uniref:CPBP family intramembrane glutamic endopeptidase n=1 Tax=Streptococcus sp. sy010 TaxID=2600148 RepID=UPI0011B729E6|nr:CPBP family intramembrane glutamic endopeptidase [Streptococcus sp. sy010]TWT14409.1 CPBP family intramembrane metalloprotease [Streptococcus sp. sy010]